MFLKIWWICVTSLEEAENFNDFGGGIIIHWQRQEFAVSVENSRTRQSCIPGLGYFFTIYFQINAKIIVIFANSKLN